MNKPEVVAEDNRTLLAAVVDIAEMWQLLRIQAQDRPIPRPMRHCDNNPHDNRHNNGLAPHDNRRNNDLDFHNNLDVHTSLLTVTMK